MNIKNNIMNKEIKLEVGNIIYCVSRYGGPRLLKVVRVTNTQAILDSGTRLRRVSHGISISEVGADSWHSSSYKLADEKDIEEYKRITHENKMKLWFSEFSKNASVEQIEKIYEMFNKNK